ncbi:hypothetical protein JTB14_032926, partial [Gonioctena quinquepunctata]
AFESICKAAEERGVNRALIRWIHATFRSSNSEAIPTKTCPQRVDAVVPVALLVVINNMDPRRRKSSSTTVNRPVLKGGRGSLDGVAP